MKILGSVGIVICCIAAVVLARQSLPYAQQRAANTVSSKGQYWFVLHRASNKEFLYYGEAGNTNGSTLVREFPVKTGSPGQRPTPLPQLVGRDYWEIVDAYSSSGNPETAPFFLQLNIPAPQIEPYGPEPYNECNGQCNWQLPGYFGLHGVAGNRAKLANTDPGSSGCIRHTDEDITYLYRLLDGQWPVRYYIYDI